MKDNNQLDKKLLIKEKTYYDFLLDKGGFGYLLGNSYDLPNIELVSIENPTD